MSIKHKHYYLILFNLWIPKIFLSNNLLIFMIGSTIDYYFTLKYASV